MSNTSRLRVFHLSHLSKPAGDRPVYQAVHSSGARKILTVGLGDGLRAMRMIEIAGHCNPPRRIQFTALDPFEARSATDGPGMSLKRAHRMLAATGAQIRLVPGDPFLELGRVANALGQVDLMVISSRLDTQYLGRAWFYVPRLLHARSQVFLKTLLPLGRTALRLVNRSEIEHLAAAATRRRAA